MVQAYYLVGYRIVEPSAKGEAKSVGFTTRNLRDLRHETLGFYDTKP
ncbi:MAG: hypothetical protein IJ828_07040 [Treponema sp.]|nr:hypothetical protein [Treponema sp.]